MPSSLLGAQRGLGVCRGWKVQHTDTGPENVTKNREKKGQTDQKSYRKGPRQIPRDRKKEKRDKTEQNKDGQKLSETEEGRDSDRKKIQK